MYTRFRPYALNKSFTRALREAQAREDAAGDIGWLAQIDSTWPSCSGQAGVTTASAHAR